MIYFIEGRYNTYNNICLGVFLNMNMETITFIIFLIAAVSMNFLSVYFEHRKQKSTWKGILVDKAVTDYLYKNKARNVYVINIKKDNGDTVTLNVNKELYSSFNAGDKLIKHSGEYYPTQLIE